MVCLESAFETSYEDGTYWVFYSLDNHNDKYSYEIFNPEEVNPSLKEKTIFQKDEVMLAAKDYLNQQEPTALFQKIELSSCSSYLQELIEHCEFSSNDMWYVSCEDAEFEGIEIKQIEELKKEIEQLELSQYVEFDNGDDLITIFGGIITKFLFNN